MKNLCSKLSNISKDINVFIGKNARNNGVFVYYQICPECKEPIVGIKESLKGEVYLNPNEVEGLVILTKERRR